MTSLITKYGVAVPRYTSYPTAPEWRDSYSQKTFEQAIERSNASQQDFSLYLHIPFCESQCYFCGCNVVISPQHGIENTYLENLKKEINYYGSLVDKKRKVSQIAWGGGTPTYLNSEQIQDLCNCLQNNFGFYQSGDNHEYAVEIDPRFTSVAQLKTLYSCGFNRVSMGLQDFNPETQQAINRIQSFELVETLSEQARAIGFKSINYDLIYGLPFQSVSSFEKTCQQIIKLNPDRIALFNYAHLPSIFPHQKKYIDDLDLPNQQEKLEIFEIAMKSFNQAGYEFIGIDHFAKKEDGLCKALQQKTLYRNFQGYTTHAGCDLFGFGITAISDVQGIYKQNTKKLNSYYNNFKQAEKFKICNSDDLERRNIIKQLMCNNFAIVDSTYFKGEIKALKPFIDDGLAEIEEQENLTTIKINELGRFFNRNIASQFDIYLRKENAHREFSKAL